jgi:hypothetical protein
MNSCQDCESRVRAVLWLCVYSVGIATVLCMPTEPLLSSRRRSQKTVRTWSAFSGPCPDFCFFGPPFSDSFCETAGPNLDILAARQSISPRSRRHLSCELGSSTSTLLWHLSCELAHLCLCLALAVLSPVLSPCLSVPLPQGWVTRRAAPWHGTRVWRQRQGWRQRPPTPRHTTAPSRDGRVLVRGSLVQRSSPLWVSVARVRVHEKAGSRAPHTWRHSRRLPSSASRAGAQVRQDGSDLQRSGRASAVQPLQDAAGRRGCGSAMPLLWQGGVVARAPRFHCGLARGLHGHGRGHGQAFPVQAMPHAPWPTRDHVQQPRPHSLRRSPAQPKRAHARGEGQRDQGYGTRAPTPRISRAHMLTCSHAHMLTCSHARMCYALA